MPAALNPLEPHLSDTSSNIGFSVPKTLRDGRYEMGKVLGQGGMAVVCVAHDTALGVDRAVKLLSPHGSARDTLRRRLKAEARAMAQLQHPNILSVHDVGQEGELDYVVMDLASGGSLQDALQNGVLPASAAVQYIVQTLSALAAAHAAGVVHRDVKPHNILLDKEGRALLADFGIALLTGDDRRTKSGVAMGSLAFMPPEQRLDAASVGPSADIYAAGSTLFNLLTGNNPVDLFLAAPDSGRWESVPDPLEPIIQRACAMSPSERWESAGDMARALMRVLQEHAVTFEALEGPLNPSFPSPSEAFTGDHKGPTSATLDAVTFMREKLRPISEGVLGAEGSDHGTITSDGDTPLNVGQVSTPDHPTLPLATSPSDGWLRWLPAGLVGVFLLSLGSVAWFAFPAADSTPTPVTAAPPTPEPAPEPAPVAPEPTPAPEPATPPPEPVQAAPESEPITPPPNPKPTPEPSPEPLAAPAGSSPVSGNWQGSAGGPWVTVKLSGPPSAIRGSITSTFGRNVKTTKLAGAYNPEGRTLNAADTDNTPQDAARFELTLSEDGTSLTGRLIRNVGGERPLMLRKAP